MIERKAQNAFKALDETLLKLGFDHLNDSGKDIYVLSGNLSGAGMHTSDIHNLAGSLLGMQIVPAMHIVNENKDTDFVGAGIQIFNSKNIFAESADDLYICQPSVRTNSFDNVDASKGFSSSFVNMCTLRRRANVQDFQFHVQQWCNLFQNIGYNQVRIEPKIREKDWGHGKFLCLFVRVFAENREIGDFGYLIDLPAKGSSYDTIDCGFGLERMAWCTGTSYEACCGTTDLQTQDPVRTATLLIGSGVTVSNKNCGYSLSKICNRIQSGLTADEVIRFHNQWSKFTPLQRGPKAIFEYIQKFTTL